MPVVGSRFGNDNHYTTGKGKGFTVICNDCGIMLWNKDLRANFCIFCEEVAVITCPGCKQESHIHHSIHCEKEVSYYVQEDARSLEQVRDSESDQ
jgi:hypothetical protein